MIEENIRHLRKNAKMSQEDLAEKLSVVRQTVSKWERGLSVPDAEMVIKMADLFGVPVSELLSMEQEHGALPKQIAFDKRPLYRLIGKHLVYGLFYDLICILS